MRCNRYKHIISKNQIAFIPGRPIVENTLLTYKMIINFNRGIKNKMRTKVDLWKAFDKINRQFILHMMK